MPTEEQHIAVVLRQRTLGEKYAYLDGLAAGIRQQATRDPRDADVWLKIVETIRESLPEEIVTSPSDGDAP
jgi:hypothetical protein